MVCARGAGGRAVAVGAGAGTGFWRSDGRPPISSERTTERPASFNSVTAFLTRCRRLEGSFSRHPAITLSSAVEAGDFAINSAIGGAGDTVRMLWVRSEPVPGN